MSENYQKWIEAGYETLAVEGREGIIIENLPKILVLINRGSTIISGI
jgi:hypothetical protein